MKKIVALFLIFSQFAYAGLPPTTIQGQNDAAPKTKFAFQSPYNQITDLGGIKALIETGNKNILSNSSFEHVTATTGWTTTKTAGTTLSSAVETSVVADGEQSIKITATAAYGTFDQSVTPTIQTVGQNYESSCRVYASSATGVPQICALAGGTEVQCVSVPVTSSWQEVSVSLPGPANGTSVGVRFKTTVSDSTSYYLDDCYVGPNRKIASGYLATDWQSYTPTTQGFGTVANMTASWRRVGGEVQVLFYFEAGAPSATEARFYLPNSYVITGLSSTGNMPTGVGFFNTNFSGGYGSVGAVNGNRYVTFSKISASRTNENGSSITTTGSGVTAKFSVPVTGWTSSQAAYKVDATPASWSGFHNGSNFSMTTSGSANTFTDFPSSTATLSTRGTPRNISCSAGTGPAISCTLPRIGNYFVCAGTQVQNNTSTTNAVAVRLVDGSGTVIDASHTSYSPATGNAFGAKLCGSYNASSVASAITFKLQGASTGTSQNLIAGGPYGLTGAAADWSIVELDAPMPAPYLVGSVTSNTSGQERIERAKITCSNSSSIISQSGSWISSITNQTSGRCTITIATGTFSAAPSCVGNVESASNTLVYGENISVSSATSMTIGATYIANGGTLTSSTNENHYLTCMGPK